MGNKTTLTKFILEGELLISKPTILSSKLQEIRTALGIDNEIRFLDRNNNKLVKMIEENNKKLSEIVKDGIC